MLDAEKLIKIAGLLGSEHAGERANAAWAASEMLKAAGYGWEDILRAAFNAQQPPKPAPRTTPYNTAYSGSRSDMYADVRDASNADRYWKQRKENPRHKVMGGIKAAHVLSALHQVPRGLTDWDKTFISDLIRKRCDVLGMTERQWQIVLELAAKARILPSRA